METNTAHNYFITKFNEIIDQIAPEKEIIIKNKYTPKEKWFTKGLLKSSRNKDKLYRKSINKPKTDETHIKYVKYRNLFNKIKRSTKAKYYNDVLEENKNDIKNTWKIMKMAMNKINDKSNISQIIKYNSNTLTNEQDITNAFCEYFTNVGPEYARNIPNTNKSPQEYLNPKIKNTIFLNPTDPEEINKLIQKLKPKNSSGHDNISSKLIKYLKDEIKEPTSTLINKSITEGIFPDIFKIAEVVPIYKNKNSEDINNYRPISLLPTISKLLEKIIHKRTYSFLQKHNILYNSQYGFRPKHSTNDAITEYITDITENLETKTNTLSTYLDLSKAFDTIDHNILLNKLQHYGIRGNSLNWFKSYLTNRSQYVKINNCKSDIKQVICGVPQGSVLGPLLFIIYTNDLPNSLKNTHAILFADDTTIYTNHKEIKLLYQYVNRDLDALFEWFKTNKLSLNINKTNFMLFTNTNLPQTEINRSIKIGNEELKRKPSIKFLGIIIDEKLNWQNHIETTRNKLSKITYSLKMVKSFLPKQNMKILYQSLIQPYLEYGITLWGGTHKIHLDKLRIVQKKIIRNITSSKYNEHTDPIFKQLNLLKLNQLYTLKIGKFMYRSTINELPQPVNKWYKPNSDYHTHNTRQRKNPHIRYRRTQLASTQISHKAPEIWHNIPNNIKQSKNIRQLTKQLKVYLINN